MGVEQAFPQVFKESGQRRPTNFRILGIALFAALTLVLGGVMPAQAVGGQTPLSAKKTAKAKSFSIKIKRSGASSIRVTWGKVKKAKTYKIRVANNAALKKPVKTVKRSAKKSRALTVKLPTALRPGQKVPVYVQVTTTAKKKPYKTKVTKFTPSISIGRASVTSVKQASSSKLTVKYSNITNATSYTISVASNQWFTQFSKTYTRSATSSKTATISLPTELQAGHGRTTFVRVEARRYRTVSVPANYRWLRMVASAGSGTTVNIASYNVCNECMYLAHGASDGTAVTDGDRDWQTRRAALAASVVRADPDVIGFQELTTSDYLDPECASAIPTGGSAKQCLVDRYVDLREAINEKAGSADKYQYAYDESDVTKSVSDPTHAGSRNAQLMYNTKTVERLDGGILDPRSIDGGNTGAMQYIAANGAGYATANYINNKWFSWGEFKKLSTGKRFYAVSVHLPEAKDAATEAVRQQQIQLIVKFIETKDSSKLPIVFVGDLNSRDEFSTSGAHAYMTNNGYVDAWNSPVATNVLYATYSGYSKVNGKMQLIAQPKLYTYPGPRIDYIFGKYISGVASYETQIVKSSSGEFDTNYQGSDHNLIRALISLG